MSTVYLAFGANLGDRVATIRRALAMLAPAVRVTAVSPLYETPPAYLTDQPAFVNGALRAETDLAPQALLAHLKGIERALGRTASVRYGPRPIDLDILFYGDRVLAEPGLEIPHPRLAERAFVLRPLADIAPALAHPVLGRTVAALLAALPAEAGIRRLEETIAV